MNYKSLSELLEEERALCAGLQTRANILDAMCEVDLEDPERAEKHRALRERLVREIQGLNKALRPLRVAIGARLLELEATAGAVIQAERERSAQGEAFVPEDAHGRADGPARCESSVQAFSPDSENLEPVRIHFGPVKSDEGAPTGAQRSGARGEVRS